MIESENLIWHNDNPFHLPEGHECDGLTGQHDILCLMQEINIFGVQMNGVIGNINIV